MSCSNDFFRRVRDCEAIEGGAESDHSTTELTFHYNSIANKEKEQTLYAGEPDYQKIVEERLENANYNEALNNLSPPNTEDYDQFFKNVDIAARMTATKIKPPNPEWFKMSKDKLQPDCFINTGKLKAN